MTTNTPEIPLIYTSKGNLPIDQLEYKHFWNDNQELAVKLEIIDGRITPIVDKDGFMEFIEEYSLDGEVVKRSVHIFKFKGLDFQAEQQEV